MEPGKYESRWLNCPNDDECWSIPPVPHEISWSRILARAAPNFAEFPKPPESCSARQIARQTNEWQKEDQPRQATADVASAGDGATSYLSVDKNPEFLRSEQFRHR